MIARIHQTIFLTYISICLALNGSAQEWYEMMKADNPNLYEVREAYEKYWSSRSFQKDGKTQYYKRWKERMEQFSDPDGYFQQPGWDQQQDENYQQMKANSLIPQNRSGRGGGWYEIGPKSWDRDAAGSGHAPGLTRMNTVEQDPNDPDIIYVGTAQAGLWRSTDNGGHWTCLTNDLMVKGIGAIAIDPFNSNVIYFGGETGIYKSLDGGTSWATSGITRSFYDFFRAWDLKIHPADPDRLLLASTDGLMLSIDGGNIWTTVSSTYHLEIEFHPTDPAIVYAIQRTSNSRCDFMRSTDNGDSFTMISNGTPDPNLGQTTQRLEIAVTPVAPDNVYLLAPGNANGNDDGLYGFYRSADKGLSFQFLCCGTGPGGIPDSTNPNIMTWNADGVQTTGQIWYDVALAVSAIDPDDVFTGGINVWRSSDGGNNFVCNAHWSIWSSYPNTQDRYVHADIHDIKVFGSKIWVVSDGGIFLSTDNGDHFTDKTAGIQGTEFYGMGSAFNDTEVLIGGSIHNGTMLKDHNVYDGWMSIFGGDSWAGFVNPGNPGILYADNAGGTYRKITLSGNRLIAPDVVSINGHTYNNSSSLEFDPRYYNHLYQFVTDTLRKSTDNGASWSTLGSVSLLGGSTSLRIAPADPDIMYIANTITPNRIYRSNDGGQSWANVTPPAALTGGYAFPRLTSMAIDGTDPDKVWVAIGTFHAGHKVLLTSDGGANWIDYSDGLPDEDVFAIVHHQGTQGGVYVGSDLAVYYRNDTMDQWQPFITDLPPVRSSGLQIMYGTGKLRNYTRGRGVWESDLFEKTGPIAHIAANHQLLSCIKDSIPFVDHSTLNLDGATWQWSFPGGTPATSTVRDPVVYYGKEGTYDVSLTVTNPTGSSSQTMKDFVTVINQCDVDPFPGLALQLDGTDNYVRIPNIPLDPNHVTFTAWVRPSGIQAEYSAIIMDKEIAAGINFRPGNEIGYHWPGGEWWWSSGLIAPADEWSHVALVATKDSIRVYLNGIGRTHTIDLDPIAWSTILVGTYRNWSDRYVKGAIDEVCIYNRALTQAEIRASMHLTKSGNDPGLEVYYQFNESSGLAMDKAHKYHGEIFGNAPRIKSTAPVAEGSSSRKQVTGPGTFDFEEAGVEMTFPATGTYPDGEVVVSRLEWYPDQQPDCVIDTTQVYWVINNYGTEGSFSMLDKIRFNDFPADPYSTQTPSGYELFTRPFNATGQTWSNSLCQASQAQASPGGYLLFDQQTNITGFGQFIAGNAVVYRQAGICVGDSLLIHGIYQDTPGSYVDSFQAQTGCDSVRVTELSVDLPPAQPDITLSGTDSLTSSVSGTGYQWLLDGEILATEEGQTISVWQNGTYQVVVYNGGCPSDTSAAYFYDMTAIRPSGDPHAIRIFPNPSDGIFQVDIPNREGKELSIILFDYLGQEVLSGNTINSLDLRGYPKGVYFLMIKHDKRVYSRKLILI